MLSTPTGNLQVQASIVASGPQPVDVAVDKNRWLHFDTTRLKELGSTHAGFKAGSRPEIVERLVMERITYGQLAGADLRFLCGKADVKPSNNNQVMAKRLVEAPYPTAAESGTAVQVVSGLLAYKPWSAVNESEPVNAAVPFGRWMHFSKTKLKELGSKLASFKAGSRAEIAERLVMNRITYGHLVLADLKFLCEKAGVRPADNSRVMAKRLVEAPYPTADENSAADQERLRREQRAEQQRQAAADAPPTGWQECMRRLRARATQQGNKMTKEAFAVQLQEWEFMDTNGDCAVYHIISPLFGGADHPDNYRVLPAHHHSDYHVSEGLALWHHIAMLRLLGRTIVKKAMEVSLGDKQLAKRKLEELEEREEQFRGAVFPPLPLPRSQGGNNAAAPGGAVPPTPEAPAGAASAAQGTPGSTAQEPSEAGPSDGAGPSSKRARTDSGAPAGTSQAEEPEVAMEEDGGDA
ncbi:hypothetical protein C2E21_6226 [Chlorella sorokiniana]|uniref:Uncharacterized protein n=1 Tax=Chlorella sorokiniana TaxID=3076 RepID=A0A2P6TKN9_CHLSO|nr:hypothetical protein C2E21_6226 [Chlorella sorokiniana]|eukprot:PRW44845.1 hypothetical protein C2E21_6226 [Chlorella sorokiniana]